MDRGIHHGHHGLNQEDALQHSLPCPRNSGNGSSTWLYPCLVISFSFSQENFPDAPPEVYASCVGRLVFYRYINQAIVTPEAFDIVSHTIDVGSRTNLAQISKLLAQIISGAIFGEDTPSMLAINPFVATQIPIVAAWLLEGIGIESGIKDKELIDPP